MRTAIIAVVLATATLPSATAAAEPPPPPAPTAEASTAPTTITTRYGAQIIVAEFAGVSAAAIGVSVGGETGALVGAGAWLLSAPAIHIANGNPDRAVAGVALRQALLWSGVAIGARLPCARVTEHYDCHLPRAVGGAMIGYGVAVILDAVFLARSTRAAPSTAPRWSPTFAAAPDGASVGLAGVF
ncbi:MAG: hypothetical protein JNK64_21605 [Myxococcales bacterium]|nr:hypothetical protein [Myxococcales bacterium]